MRFWLAMMTENDLRQLPEIARHAESLGFEGVTYADHLVIPATVESKYPYTPDGKIFWPGEASWPDPWITLSVMGEATSRLKLATNIYLAALRDPFTAAKSVATTAAFAPGRVVCGVSVGWIKEEYEQAGIDFHSRGKRLDEVLACMRKLWTGEIVRHEGQFFRFEAIMRPAPPAPVPIWAGGMTPGALARAAANDGWLGVPLSLQKNLEIVAHLYDLREKSGKGRSGFSPCIYLTEPLTTASRAKLEQAGIGDMLIIPWFPTPWETTPFIEPGADITRLDVKKRAMTRFAEAVIAQHQ